jgi:hypothetical protein
MFYVQKYINSILICWISNAGTVEEAVSEVITSAQVMYVIGGFITFIAPDEFLYLSRNKLH